jgi:hypothetical protein
MCLSLGLMLEIGSCNCGSALETDFTGKIG